MKRLSVTWPSNRFEVTPNHALCSLYAGRVLLYWPWYTSTMLFYRTWVLTCLINDSTVLTGWARQSPLMPFFIHGLLTFACRPILGIVLPKHRGAQLLELLKFPILRCCPCDWDTFELKNYCCMVSLTLKACGTSTCVCLCLLSVTWLRHKLEITTDAWQAI
mgnify:CR=1 FL=1